MKTEELTECPKCQRSWPRPCEQTICIDFYQECMVCKFGMDGTGTKEELDRIVKASKEPQ